MQEQKVYQHLSPGKLYAGSGAASALINELPGDAIYLMVTDKGLSRAGTAGRISQAMARAALDCHVFDGVEADPPIEVVERALEFARAQGCTAVLGLGGGSSLDAAKAVAVRLRHETSLREYGDGLTVPGPIAPLYAIPTTAGTGSEVTRVAVISDPEKKEKMAIRGFHLAPLAAALDPEMLKGIPPRIAAETGMDALTHAVEAYVSLNANTISDVLSLGAIEKIGKFLRRLAADPGDREAGLEMLVASCLAGQAFTNAGLGLAHSMGEPLGGYYHVSHGLACAIFLPVIMEFNLPVAPARFAAIGRALLGNSASAPGDETGVSAVEAVRELLRDLGLPLTYEQAGIDFKLLPQMVEDVFPQFSTQCNPRRADAAQISALYNAPLKGK